MTGARAEASPSARFYLGLWVAFSALALALYWPALSGPLISDDLVYLVFHPWTAELSVGRTLEILDPTGEARFFQVNYAPLHLLLTAIERQVFGANVVGYHVVNVLLHAANATLLAALLTGAGLSARVAQLGALLFLVHPANVEAVAWSSQLKTDAALALALGALLTLRAHPLLASSLFAAGLLTKASAVFALPMAAAFAWAQPRDTARSASVWRWLGLWTLLFALYSIPQVTAFQPRGTAPVNIYPDLWVQLLSIASIGMRYLVMATTSLGLSYGPEHAPVESLLDPWTLCALPVAALLSWRIVVTLKRRSPEAGFWIGAAAGFAPVSQIFPFVHPLGDRYLYFILPGLIGGILFGLRDAREWCAARWSRGDGAAFARTAVRVATALGCIAAVFFATATAKRAYLWKDALFLELDSERNFPGGRIALSRKAKRLAQAGDASAAVAALRRASELGWDDFRGMRLGPMLRPLHGHPEFEALMRELAAQRIELLERREPLTAFELRERSAAQLELGDHAAAVRSLEQAVARKGPLQAQFESELEMLRAAILEGRAGDTP